METIEAISSRRSVRKFKPDAIPDETVKRLLEAGMCSPSAGNERPWFFIVINDRYILDKIPEIHPFSTMITRAPAAILVCGDREKEIYKGFWPQDCAAASQNILLAAHASGLGAVWLGVYPLKDRVRGFQKLFSLPKNIIPFSIIPIGMPDEKKAFIERYDEGRVKFNDWI